MVVEVRTHIPHHRNHRVHHHNNNGRVNIIPTAVVGMLLLLRSTLVVLVVFHGSGLLSEHHSNNGDCHAFTTTSTTTTTLLAYRPSTTTTRPQRSNPLHQLQRQPPGLHIQQQSPLHLDTTTTTDSSSWNGTVVSYANTTLVPAPASRSRTTTKSASTTTSSPRTTSTSSTTKDDDSYRRGILVLMTVPLAWGTYTPVIQYLYTQPDLPIPGLFFSGSYYIVAALTLWIIIRTRMPAASPQVSTNDSDNDSSLKTLSELTGSMVPMTANAMITNPLTNTAAIVPPPPNCNNYWYGGMELGLYLFVANVLQIIGLQSVPADRAGFLVQLTTLFVPLLEAFVLMVGSSDFDYTDASSSPETRRTIPPATWIACGLALVGVLVFDINVDEITNNSISSTTAGASTATAVTTFQNVCHMIGNTVAHIGTGDYLIMAAAVLYSFHVVRLGRYAQVCDALPLAASKATVEAVLSVGLVALLLTFHGTAEKRMLDTVVPTTAQNGVLTYVTDAGREMTTFLTSITSTLASNGIVHTMTILTPALGAVLWTGWVTCAYTIFAQSYGQSRVPPTQANLVYSIQPLCTALFAYVLLGETLSPTGYIGAAFIAAAVYIVAVADDRQQ